MKHNCPEPVFQVSRKTLVCTKGNEDSNKGRMNEQLSRNSSTTRVITVLQVHAQLLLLSSLVCKISETPPPSNIGISNFEIDVATAINNFLNYLSVYQKHAVENRVWTLLFTLFLCTCSHTYIHTYS